ncbi:helix-turn-helix transcriptional regulator [Nocardia sp. NPDC005978]|uniref:helix-turn-helix transcriptional regulator n=1 Tax=Nocardia sp. NPDC005978 TaxID=3156725 RepID=UPI0033AF1717
MTDPVRSTRLGDFLRARREQVRPEDVGLASGPYRRRTPGLRREEVAVRAAITPDYYARLEQGRAHTPSAAVLRSLSAALLLTDEQSEHLHRLAARAHPRRAAERHLNPRTQAILDGIPQMPALVLDTMSNILACNHLADVLYGGLLALPAPERNMLWQLFGRSCTRERFDRDDLTRLGRLLISNARADATGFDENPDWTDLVTTLRATSPLFDRIWHQHHIGSTQDGHLRLRHDTIGPVDLSYTMLPLPEPGQRLVLHVSEPGPGSRTALDLLAVIGHEQFAPH